ncbi:hypothetical protein C8J57DRAFT_1289265 [Mycena rebaudengoi]|nr:hypothetical protein C8J57DRAFT_1289265 [Mycena rebaudengoi]
MAVGFAFTSQEIPGAIVVNVFAILSTFALLSVAFRVIYFAVARRLSGSSDSQSREYVFFNTVLGNYAGCLLLANIVVGAAGIMGLNQLVRGGIEEGMFCTTQAIVMQVGNFAGAYFTVAIGIHTFNSLVLARRQSPLICAFTVAIGWISSCLIAVAPLLSAGPRGPRYGISGLGCGIKGVYPKELFLLHLLPIFLCSIMSALLYSIIFLVLRGSLVIKGGIKLSLDPNERWGGGVKNYHKFVARIARSMLWIPIAYILLLVPYSLTRLIDISGRTCPFPLVVAAAVFWFLLGVANVMTLYNTFRVLGPAFGGMTTSQKDLESNVGSSVGRPSVIPPMIAAGGGEYPYRSSMEKSPSSPASLTSFDKVTEAPATNPGAPFRLMAPPIAARIQERREESMGDHRRSISSQWTQNTTPSFYDYGTTPEMSEAPRHKTQLSQLLLNEPPVTTSPRSSRRLLPPSQIEPVQSLPAPPRTVIRQVAHRATPVASSPHSSIEVRYSSTTVDTEEDITGWLDEQRPDGYMPRGLVSAVGTNYSVPANPVEAPPMPERAASVSTGKTAGARRPRNEAGSGRPRNNSSPTEPSRLA